MANNITGAARPLSASLTSTIRPVPRLRTTPHRSHVHIIRSRRCFSTTDSRPATPLYMLSALSHARETQHYARRSGLGVTNHVPHLEAIKSSEVDPFQDKKEKPTGSKSGPGATPSAAVAETILRVSHASLETTKPSASGVARTKTFPTAETVFAAPQPVSSVQADATNTQLALVVLVVALVGMNAYFFEQLAGERREREKLIGRIQRLEQSGSASSSARRARREERRKSREVRGLPAAAPGAPDVTGLSSSSKSQGGLGGFVRSMFWAS